MQPIRFHQRFDYRCVFKIASKGRVLLAITTMLGSFATLMASPTGGVVTSGGAVISSGASSTTITQSSNRAMNANGQVFLINPNGIIFDKGAQVNVGGMVATTLNLSDLYT